MRTLLILKRYILFLSVLASALNVVADDSLEVSILTCEPGNAIYELYGHTAIRVKELRKGGRDDVFNYGVFNFDAPFFMWRFIKGETDYMVIPTPYDFFAEGYIQEGRRVWQQTLQLDSLQKLYMAALLWENCRPENRCYRYNFLYNNCTSRCRDIIEAVADVKWPQGEKKTYRQIIHEFAGENITNWNSFGQDLLLGWSVDTLIDARAQMFSPIYFMRYIDSATVCTRDGAVISLAQPLQLIIGKSNPQHIAATCPMPLFDTPKHDDFMPIYLPILFFLLIGGTIPSAIERNSGVEARWRIILMRVTYSLMMLLAITLSVVITMLFTVSEHPGVDTNMLIWGFNPFTVCVAAIPWLKLKIKEWGSNRGWHRLFPIVCAFYLLITVGGSMMCAVMMYTYGQSISIPLGLFLLAYCIISVEALLRLRPIVIGRKLLSYVQVSKTKNNNTAHPQRFNAQLLVAPIVGLGAPLFATTAQAQSAPHQTPKLVLMISVDQLRTDYIEAFSPLFCDNGLLKLMQEGRLYSCVQYPFAHPDGTSAPACLFSGASPYDNGVVGATYLDRETLRPKSAVDGFTPSLLSVSTITDELKIATGGKAQVFAIAHEAGAAIFSAGHAADGALWLDPNTAEWVTSAYYETPEWLERHNSLSKEGMERIWQPITPLVGTVNYYVGKTVSETFYHKFKTAHEYLTSGLINEKITEGAIQCMRASALGKDNVTDILAVTYYAGGWQHQTIEACGMEMQDTYVRLDNTIAALISQAEEQVAPGGLMVVLTSTGYCDRDVPNLAAYRIPTGTFNMTRARSLLNMYLGAVYGPANYVEAVYENGLYLDHTLIEQKQINLAELLERSQDLLLQMSGVKDVYTSTRLALGAWTPGVRALRNAHHPKYRGDITLNIASGWHIVQDEIRSEQFSSESYLPFPLIFWGTDIVPAKIETPIEIDCVAPTVAQVLRIRSPNACQAAPLTGLR